MKLSDLEVYKKISTGYVDDDDTPIFEYILRYDGNFDDIYGFGGHFFKTPILYYRKSYVITERTTDEIFYRWAFPAQALHAYEYFESNFIDGNRGDWTKPLYIVINVREDGYICTGIDGDFDTLYFLYQTESTNQKYNPNHYCTISGAKLSDVNLYIFSTEKVASNANFGFEAFNADGQDVFLSDRKPMRILSNDDNRVKNFTDEIAATIELANTEKTRYYLMSASGLQSHDEYQTYGRVWDAVAYNDSSELLNTRIIKRTGELCISRRTIYSHRDSIFDLDVLKFWGIFWGYPFALDVTGY